MRAAAKSKVFAGEESEDEESEDEDDEWLDDVEVSKDEIVEADESREEAESDLPMDAAKGAEEGVVSEASGGKSGLGAGGKDASEGGGGHAGLSSSGGRKVGGKSSSSNSNANAKSSSAKPAFARVPNTSLQKKITGKLGDGRRALYYKHASGRELAASFMNSTGTILQETSQQIQEINNAMRYLQDNLW